MILWSAEGETFEFVVFLIAKSQQETLWKWEFQLESVWSPKAQMVKKLSIDYKILTTSRGRKIALMEIQNGY